MRRLLKTLRHDTPTVAETATRRALPSDGATTAECFKVLHQSHAGKLSLCRVWSGSLVEGQSVGGQRIGGLLRPFGQRLEKVGEARAGEIVALAKVDDLSAGQSLGSAGIASVADHPAAEPAVFTLSLAARIALSEAMPKCRPVLLEPILKVTVAAPSEATPRIQRLISGRRGQLLGFDARAGWNGWDEVSALMPEAEIADMIVEIRSVTQGVGTFRTAFDHLQELAGRTAERIVEETRRRAAA